MPPQEYLCTVKSYRLLTPTVFELAFDTDRPLAFAGGQFVSVVVPKAAPSGRDLRRAYSIASPPERHPIELCVKLVEDGPGSGFLGGLRPGDTFRCFAPYGDFTYKPVSARSVCFVTTGTGVAPARAMAASPAFQAEYAKTGAHPMETLVVLGVRSEDELLYAEEFRALPQVRFVTAITQPQASYQGFRGRVTDYFRAQGPGFPWASTDFYLCGNGGMITEMKTLLLERGVKKEAIHQEIYYK